MGLESLTFTSAFKPGQKYLVVNTPSSNNTADVDRDGTAETYTKDSYITLHDPVATKLDASASNGAASFTGTASNTQLTIMAQQLALEILTWLLMEQHTRLRLA